MGRLGKNLLKSLKNAYPDAKSTWKVNKDKPFLKRLIHTIYLSDIADYILDPYYSIINLYHKIERIIEWIPVLWRTYDWNHGFLLEIWCYSFKRLKKGIIDDGHHVNTPKEIRRLNTVIALLTRMRNDNYIDKHTEILNKRWGKDNFKDMLRPIVRNGITYYEVVDPIKERTTPEEYKQYIKEHKELFKLEDYLFKQDVDLLCKILKNHMKSFWD